MAEFAKYAFNKSHAAAYAVLSYRTAYLKTYYKEELMAATLNSFLGNLDKVPVYIQDCKDMGIEILNPSINDSETKFTVSDNKIRFGLGSIKNVGTGVVDSIVEEREKNGLYESFTDFCERTQNYNINRRCIESMIKAGVFDSFGKTRNTLLASFENILDIISNENKNKMENQVSMFDMMDLSKEETETQKYTFVEKEEMDIKELLRLEKEMLGVYISGHPLDKIKDKIEKETNFSSRELIKMNEEIEEFGESKSVRDGMNVKLVGIISDVKKKFTRKNTTMAFVRIDDFYGSIEVIVFDNVYSRSSSLLVDDSIVYIEGKISIREDEGASIIASKILNYDEIQSEEINTSSFHNIDKNKKVYTYLNIDITGIDEEKKENLRVLIKKYRTEKPNIRIDVTEAGIIKPCGFIYCNENILKEFKNIISNDRIKLQWWIWKVENMLKIRTLKLSEAKGDNKLRVMDLIMKLKTVPDYVLLTENRW